jgi:tetratricopeptide (TPR) repeat protein
LSSQALITQAASLADAGKPDEAMDICNRVLLEEPDNPGALYVASCVLLQAGRHMNAIQLAKRHCDLRPKDPRGWGMLALCYGELCRYDESVRYAERALSLKRSAKTLADMAYAYTNGGDWDLADKLSLEALKLGDRKGHRPDKR